MMDIADLVNSDTEYSLSSGVQDSDFSENFSEGTLSRSNSIERLKQTKGYVEENFRIDRRKLEAMILGCPPDPWDTEVMNIPIDENGRVKSAEDFFDEIMAATNTVIKYPKYLKVGARNKKDPHVRVFGSPEAVSEASQRIRNDLQPHNKITMKMDVPWTCHSHIIGKGGNTIQPVVKRTGVSIHFPDGNKNSELHKSNQVSINSRGEDISGLEEARRSIRDLTPLIFTFSLPAGANFISIVNNTSLFVSNVHNIYNVQADIQLLNENIIYGSVKGTEWDSVRVKEATLYLLQALCGNLASQMTVQLTIEVSPQHHQLILGRNRESIKKIMQRTATKITFPDANDPMLIPLKRSTITILGGIENVYVARQNIIGSLPLVLLFDLLPDSQLDQKEVIQIMQTLDVIIIVKNQRMDGKRNVVIRGLERNASNIYEAWRVMNRSMKPAPKANIPLDYHVPVMTLPYEIESGLLSPVNNITPDLNPGLSSNDGTHHCFCHISARLTWGGDCCSSPPCEINNNDPLKIDKQVEQLADSFPNSCSIGNITLEEMNSLVNLIPDRRAPGCEKRQGLVSDYLTKKILAAKLMKQPVFPEEPRTPTATWSGYGLSKSQPAHIINQLKNEEKSNFDTWRDWSGDNSSRTSSSGLTEIDSNFVPEEKLSYGCDDFMIRPPKPVSKCSSSLFDSVLLRPHYQTDIVDDINGILVNLQLEQYIDLFAQYGINFESFCSLTDQDLQDMGVLGFGHRKKLLMSIKNLCLLRGREKLEALT